MEKFVSSLIRIQDKHATAGEVSTSNSQFIKLQIGDEHLPQSIPTIGLSPGLFYSLDVFGFHDWRTKPIWGTKCMD